MLEKLAREAGAKTEAAAPLVLASPPPRATYRLQFHKDFTFEHAVAIVPYLARLGVSHLYSSPIHKARPGSTHGYDIVDHSEINPELGGEAGFLRLSDALKQHGLGLVLDIVPNHMGVGGADNAWWLSVLEWGELSDFASAFDIDWQRLGAGGKLVVPFLGDQYGWALEKGTLKLAFDAQEGSFSIWHYEHRFPITPLSYPIVLDRALAALEHFEGQADVLAVSERLRAMEAEAGPERRAAFPEEAERLKQRLADAVAQSPKMADAIARAVALINGDPTLPESFGTLHRILEMQAYRLAHWRVAASDVNYRRFFDINALAGIRVEDPNVFERTHEMVFRLVREGRIQGLRIDHIDGLADPESYLKALQDAVGPGFFVLAEKILEPGEPLRRWPLSGTTGYDILNLIDAVFVDRQGEAEIERRYREWTGFSKDYGALLLEAKTAVLETSFASELEVLMSDVKRIADADRRTRDYTVYSIRRALVEIVSRFPVYRTYLTAEAPAAEDRELIHETVEAAKAASILPDRSVHDFIASALLGELETDELGRPDRRLVERFRRRFQQLTGPVMAKSLEDTLFYRYVPLISLNEVGGDLKEAGIALGEFHRANAARARDWPHTMIATATHDTKRGEDARARLDVLSEMPEAWGKAFERFRAVAKPYVRLKGNAEQPDTNDQYLLFQTLLGAWPLELLDAGRFSEEFIKRIEAYFEKALREAKRHTSWMNNNEGYESAARDFVRGLLGPQSPLAEEFRPLARRLSGGGMVNGLVRTVLKCTLPGIPDVYQGTEFWDFSLVDPDNRRPVDYAARERTLGDDEPSAALLARWQDGAIKQRLLATLLADRAENPELYADGDYRPLFAEGEHAEHVVAFTRERRGEELLVVVPRLSSRLLGESGAADRIAPEAWGDTRLRLPPGRWTNVLTGEETVLQEESQSLGALLPGLPVAVWKRAAP